MSRAIRAAALAAAFVVSGCVSPERPAAERSSARPVTETPRPARPAGGVVSSLPMGPARSARGGLPAPVPLTVQPTGETARAQGVRAGPDIATLGLTDAEARAALATFRVSCRSLVRRADASGLTQGADWAPACDAAAGARDARRFFAEYFETAQIGAGAAFATGYYEPEIRGSRERRAGYEVPIYARPADLVEVDLGQFADDLKGRKVRGRATEGSFGLYPDRAAIEDGALAGKGLEVAWAADVVEFFFLQVQGSGLIRLPDGGIMRIGYDTQNGRGYTGIGKLMRDRGLLGPGQTSMQGIMAWLRANPAEGRAIMHENKSFVFFRELTGAGPLGALGLPVTGRVTVAADPKFVPLGAPVFLALDRGEASGLWVAQDTGGAIKGANRFDTYWGSGSEARTVAGGMSGRGTAWLLLPRGVVARLSGGGDGGAQARP